MIPTNWMIPTVQNKGLKSHVMLLLPKSYLVLSCKEHACCSIRVKANFFWKFSLSKSHANNSCHVSLCSKHIHGQAQTGTYKHTGRTHHDTSMEYILNWNPKPWVVLTFESVDNMLWSLRWRWWWWWWRWWLITTVCPGDDFQSVIIQQTVCTSLTYFSHDS